LERLVGKIYFRFFPSLHLPPGVARRLVGDGAQEDQHEAILLACKSIIQNYDESFDPSVSPDKANELKTRLLSFLSLGNAGLELENSFRVALEIETSEIDSIYSKLVSLGGPNIAQTMENLDVPSRSTRLTQLLYPADSYF
jgi:hypothetical protein